MALTDIAAVRLKTSDQPQIVREVGEGNGVESDFKLQHQVVLTSPAPKVFKNGLALILNTEYTIDHDNGIVKLTAIPAVNDRLVFEYFTVVYTDAEIEHFLTDAGGNTSYAAALNLLAWAANAAKLAKKESLAGGVGYGSVTLDLAVRAEQLRKSAMTWLELYNATEGAQAPAESITEVAWTEQTYNRIIDQDLVRD